MKHLTTAMLLAATVSAHAGLPIQKTSKVSADLMRMAEPSSTLRSSDSRPVEDVVVDMSASSDAEALAAELRSLGAGKVTVFGRMVSAILPTSAIPKLNGMSSLHQARPAYRTTLAGQFTSQGDAAQRSDVARPVFGIDGTGVMVGTLSDSYNCFGGAGQLVVSGDLPRDVLVLDDFDFCQFHGSDEGQAMMEIIHDVAPGARLAFHTAFEGQASFAQGIIDLADAGAQVITDDILYFAEPMFQDGIIAQAVDTVRDRGVSYFSAAGNYGRRSYETPFRPSNQFLDTGLGPQELHDFDPGPVVDTCQQVTIPVGHTMWIALQWDQPFFSASGPPGTQSDIDLVFTDDQCNHVGFGGLFEPNIGSDPSEVGGVGNEGNLSSDKLGIRIVHVAGPHPVRMKVVNFGSDQVTFDEFAPPSGTSWGHAAVAGGLGVGAANFRETPAFAVSPPKIEEFSSGGGTPILFDTAGHPISAQVRQQPDIVAPDGVHTVSFGVFFGTSAAAPHAAGVAALLKDLEPTLTPADIYGVLKETAIDMDDPLTSRFDTGFDFATGFGLIQADKAANIIAPQPEPIPTSPPADPGPGVDPVPVQPTPPGMPTGPGLPPTIPPPGPVGPISPPTMPPTQPIGPGARSELCRGLRPTIYGTEGDDVIIGTDSHDVIHGLTGKDVIRGNGGRDVICGGPGHDRVFGGNGNDRLFGDSGRDRLNGGRGRDRCNGGGGIDAGKACER